MWFPDRAQPEYSRPQGPRKPVPSTCLQSLSYKRAGSTDSTPRRYPGERKNTGTRLQWGNLGMSVQSRIVVLCGKGGVGKTTLSLALGLYHAAQGRKVVVVSSHPLPELAVSVSLEGLEERLPEEIGRAH